MQDIKRRKLLRLFVRYFFRKVKTKLLDRKSAVASASDAALPHANMHGKVCLVTGANCGIGKATALALARMGATVVMVCRDASRGQAALAAIKASSNNDAVFLLLADLSVQQQVRRLAAEFQQKFDRLDVLINNAGRSGRQRLTSADGIEMTLAVNHLAPFLLTNLLLAMLQASAPSRVVNVSSEAHRLFALDLDDLQNKGNYEPFAVYSQTKLANVLFTYELAQRLKGTGVTANCLHPGLVLTEIFRHSPWWTQLLIAISRPLFLQPAAGADTVLYLASAPEVATVSGCYFKRRKQVPSSAASYDRTLARRLWESSATMMVG